MKNNDLLLTFTLATFALFFRSALFPHVPIYPFAPFLVILILQARYLSTLWIAIICGVMTDLASTSFLGFHSLSFFLTTFLLYRQKRFFNDKPFNICLFTLIVSITLTLVEFVLLHLFQKQMFFSMKWFFTDLLIMPFIDVIYAFIWFVAPLTLIHSLKKNWKQFKTTRRR